MSLSRLENEGGEKPSHENLLYDSKSSLNESARNLVQSIIITALLVLGDRVFHGNTASMVEFALDWHRMECTECFNSIAQQSVSFRNAWTNSGNPDLFIVPGIESTLRIRRNQRIRRRRDRGHQMD